MLIVLNDLIADFSLRIPSFPIHARDLPKVSYLELGPGGATNIAIMAARYGLPVTCLGEIGDDPFGDVVREGLVEEGVDMSDVVTLPETHTPVAGVIVDERSEPAYLGYPGHLHLRELPGRWQDRLVAAQAVFTDGWAEHDGIVGMALAALGLARKQGIPTFFDPGPGNPGIDNTWHQQAAALAAVVLATRGRRQCCLTGRPDALASARTLLARGSELVIIKRGVAGCVLVTSASFEISTGLPVEARDATGAGEVWPAPSSTATCVSSPLLS